MQKTNGRFKATNKDFRFDGILKHGVAKRKAGVDRVKRRPARSALELKIWIGNKFVEVAEIKCSRNPFNTLD